MGWGVMEVDMCMPSQPTVMLGLMGSEIIQHHMEFRLGVLGHDPVHEVQELSTPPAAEVPHMHQSTMDLQGGKERSSPMALVLVGVSAQRLAVGETPRPVGATAPRPG